jgi:hypothetical protein
MNANNEKIVIAADLINAQKVRPNTRYKLLRVRLRHFFAGPAVGAGNCDRSTLPLGVSGICSSST